MAVLLLVEEPFRVLRQQWPLLPVGILGALVGNATAIGGGLVFIPYAMIFGGLEPVASLKLALCAQAVGMTTGALAWHRRQRATSSMLGIAVLSGVGGAVVGGTLLRPGAALVEGLFGPISIGLGLLVLSIGAGRSGQNEAPKEARVEVALVAATGGLITAWVAIGAGELIAAWLIVRHRVRADRAIPLGVAVLAGCSIALAALHAGWLGNVPWEPLVVLSLGVFVGARLAPTVALLVGEQWLKWLFGGVAIANGGLVLARWLAG